MANLEDCVHCGLCLNSCPTYRVTGLEVQSPRGRLVLLSQWEQDDGVRDQDTRGWLDDCLDCRACEAVCPAHIPTGHLVEEWRSQEVQKTQAPLGLVRLLGWFLGSRAGLMWFRRMLRISQTRWGQRLIQKVAPILPKGAPGVHAGLPRIQGAHLSRSTMGQDDPNPNIFFFVGCVMDAIYSDTNQHAADLLRLAGQSLSVPTNQRCCGAVHRHSGSPQLARRWAEENIRAFELSGAERIVVDAAGCGAALKEYGSLFPPRSPWRPRAEKFEQAVVDVVELLQEALPALREGSGTITVHDPCHHVHAQGIAAETRLLLKRAGYHIMEMHDSSLCCGSAGIYNLTHPETSQDLLDRKLASIPPSATHVAAANPGCLMHIQSGLTRAGGRTALHPIDLAWQAYRTAGLVGVGEGASING